MPLSLAVTAGLAITPEAVTVSRADVALGAIRSTRAAGSGTRAGVRGSSISTSRPRPARILLASLPDAVRGPLDGMGLAGTFGGRVRLAVDSRHPRATASRSVAR